MAGDAFEERFARLFTRSYGPVCLAAAVLGVVSTLWALTWDPLTAGVLAFLTVLLLPAYLLVRWRSGPPRR